jgi:hypothetical protein
MKTVPLHGKKAAGRVALVDDADYELVMAYTWHAHETNRNSGPYADANIRRADGNWTTIRMHKLITGYPQTDHVNHDGLDNRRANLRPATTSQNNANQRPRKGCASPYKGVCWDSWRQRWQADIQVDGHRRCLGRFRAEEDAARAYDTAALAAWGEYACINFAPVFEP